MKRAKGLLLIVAGSSVLSPVAFGLSFYAYFRLHHVAVGIDAEPSSYALLALELALAGFLWLWGAACCRTSPAR